MTDYQPPLIPKVSVFVIDEADRLLVFEHTEVPSAGFQVPAGTIERDEQPLTAGLRELCEETGKQSFDITRMLAGRRSREVRNGRAEIHDRWFFQAVPTQPLPEEWIFGEAHPTGWIPFRFFWVSRTTAASVLTPDHVEIYKQTAASHDRT